MARELRLRVLLLDAVPLFRLCSAREIEDLATAAWPASFSPGETLCVEREETDRCYVIAAGEAIASIGDEPLGLIGPDDVVGERAPLLGVTRGATVSALSHVLAYAIPAKKLRTLACDNPELGAAMRADIERRHGSISR